MPSADPMPVVLKLEIGPRKPGGRIARGDTEPAGPIDRHRNLIRGRMNIDPEIGYGLVERIAARSKRARDCDLSVREQIGGRQVGVPDRAVLGVRGFRIRYGVDVVGIDGATVLRVVLVIAAVKRVAFAEPV